MSDNGRITCIQAAARIGRALTEGPLTLHGACLVAEELTLSQWKQLSYADRQAIRSRVTSILDQLTTGLIGGRMLAESTQGRTTIYFLVES